MTFIFHVFTAAEDDTSVLLTKYSRASAFNLSTQLALDFELPPGDFITIQSERPVMVLQHTGGHCTDTGEGSRLCSTSSVTIVPSLKGVAMRYLLNPLNQGNNTTVTINMIVKGQQINNILFNDVALPHRNKEMINLYLYGVTGQFNLYRLELLATSGIIKHRNNGFLLISQTTPLMHVQSQEDKVLKEEQNGSILGTNIPITGKQLSDPHSTSIMRNTSSSSYAGLTSDIFTINSTSWITNISHSPFTTSSQVTDHNPSTSSFNNRKSFKEYLDGHLNDILKQETKAVSDVRGLPSVIHRSGIPFVVKKDKDVDEINFHEMETRHIWRENNGDGQSLDITVIAVIVSLASAIILVIVVVFGFFIAEFVYCKDKITLAKVLFSVRRFTNTRRRLGDTGPLIKDNFEMFPHEYDNGISP